MKDFLGREEALEVAEARRLLMEQELRAPRTEPIPIEAACGRVLSGDVLSPENLPGFTRSTMDGYAVGSADTFGASETMPVYLEVTGQVQMGVKPDLSIQRGECVQIPTGGMLPGGSDAVVMFEHTNTIDETMVEIMKAVSPGDNVILEDEDVMRGETVLRQGQRLRPQDIGALAGLGILRVDLFAKPVVAIIGTGDEVVPPDQPIAAGKVRDINSYNLAGLVQGCHAVPVMKGIVSDDLDALRARVEEAASEADMVLISGGSSVGTKDFTSRVIDDLGSPGVLFHGVAMKPGKPLIAGIVGGVPLFGLPGHPAAITVSFATFVEPLLMLLSGEKPAAHRPHRATLRALFSRNLASSTGREEHVRISVEERDGTLWAVPVLGKSGLVTTLVKADGIVIVPMKTSGLYQGEEVEVLLFK